MSTLDVTDINNAFGSSYSPHNLAIDLGVGIKIVKGLSAAVNLRYINSKMYEDAANAFGVDVQFMYNIKRTNIGLSVNNIGTKTTYNNEYAGTTYPTTMDMPTNIKLGASHNYFKSDMHSLTSVLEMGYVLAPKDSRTFFGSLGLEYGLKDMFFVRAAYSLADDTKYIPSHFSCGLGVKVIGIGVDVAYLTAFSDSPLNNTFAINLSYGF